MRDVIALFDLVEVGTQVLILDCRMISRFVSFFTVIFGVLLLTFLLIHLVPGDPVEVMLGESASTADRETLRADLGLNQPLIQQFGSYLSKLAHGDLGNQFIPKRRLSSSSKRVTLPP